MESIACDYSWKKGAVLPLRNGEMSRPLSFYQLHLKRIALCPCLPSDTKTLARGGGTHLLATAFEGTDRKTRCRGYSLSYILNLRLAWAT